MKKLITSITILTIITLTIAGCGADEFSDAAPPMQATTPAVAADYGSNGGFDNSSARFQVGKQPESGEISETESQSLTSNPNNPQVSKTETERKIIRDAYMSIETKDVDGLYADLSAYAVSLGGYEFSSNMNNYDDSTIIDATLKIPPENLNTFMNYAGEVETATIISSRVNSDDVTSEFYDLTSRLESKRRSLDSYYNLLEKATSVEEIVYLQRTIDGIIEDIEAIEGRLRVLNNLTDMSTVTLRITTERDDQPVRKDIEWSSLSGEDMGYFISYGFTSVVNVITFIFKWLAIVLIVLSPLWVPALIIIAVILKVRKGKIKKMNEYIANVNANNSINPNANNNINPNVNNSINPNANINNNPDNQGNINVHMKNNNENSGENL